MNHNDSGIKYFLTFSLRPLLFVNRVSVGKFYQRVHFRNFVLCTTSFLFYFDYPRVRERGLSATVSTP
jgi:hypothetical protein